MKRMKKTLVARSVALWVLLATSCLAETGRAGAREASITPEDVVWTARAWIREPQASLVRGPALSSWPDTRARDLVSWEVELTAGNGWPHDFAVDAFTGDVVGWRTYRPGVRDSATEPPPAVSREGSRQFAEDVALRRCSVFASGRFRLALGGNGVRSQDGWMWAWDEVLEARSGALGPLELFVEVDGQTGEAMAVSLPSRRPISVATSPSVGRAEMLMLAHRFALLDPARYPINRMDLRVGMDAYGAQRLVWECYQILYDFGPDGLHLYGVVYDAHTGDPLYPIAPYSRSSESRRRVAFPQRCTVSVEPGRRSFGTTLEPPRMVSGSLWVRAEHLRAVDGIGVDAQKGRLAVHHAGKGHGATDLGATWRDYGWWVPLRRAAKALGWRVEWLHAKKEAVVHTVERRAAPAP